MTSVDPRVVHVVVGPEQHGVVRHGVDVAEACGHQLIRRDEPGPVDLDPDAIDVVHLPYADRLYAPKAEDSAAAFRAMVEPWHAAGIAVSVTLHDLPGDQNDHWTRRRRAAYDAVVRQARGVVVNSRRELELADRLQIDARSRRCIPLPVDSVPVPHPRPPTEPNVVVLGFVFPDRGYEPTIDALPADTTLVALGRPSEGHEDLPTELAERAAARGCSLVTTGFVPDAELAQQLWSAGVPVAPNRRVAASGSINTWIAHGRRPLVPDSPYTRELAARWPGTLTVYDPDDPADLARRIAAAVADPELTRLGPDVAVGPSLADVAVDYRRHFAGCAPQSPITVGRHIVVPGNRWDLIPATTETAPSVSVVIPYFDQQADLDLVLTALAAQTHPLERLQVIVADDGSPRPPDTGAAIGLDCKVVRQADDGFRAAAARNLGAGAAEGEVLLFLDADTVPEPAYVAQLAARPAQAPDVLTVGRRCHADLDGWGPDRLRDWFAGGAAPAELESPRWLRDAYAESADLLHADHRSYRHVISAVLGLHRDLFTELGGFDDRFQGYGGEDWELAHRAWSAGAVFCHVPEAVAWHHGPDWAGRAERGPGSQNEQTLVLSQWLPDPEARGGGSWELPAVVVRLAFDDPVAVLATTRAALAGDADAGVWVEADGAERTVARLGDPRVHAGAPLAAVLASAQAVVELRVPARITGLPELVRRASAYGPLGLPTGTVVPRRVATRAERWAGWFGAPAEVLEARLFGGWDLAGPVGSEPVDLAHELKYTFAAHRR